MLLQLGHHRLRQGFDSVHILMSQCSMKISFHLLLNLKKKTFKDINKNFVGGANLIFIEWMTDALCLSAFSI